MQFEQCVGQKFGFYGVDHNVFKIGKTVFEAIEDESDGYRSYLQSIEVKDPSGLIFFKRAVAKVEVVRVDETTFDGFALRDVRDGHEWLRLGTDQIDDYYPSFTFRYEPKAKS